MRLSTERPHAGHQSTGTAIDHATAPRTIVRVETELLARLPLRYRLRRGLGEGRALYRAVVEAELEGIVAKRLTDPYRPTLTRWHKLDQTYSQRHGRAEWFLKRQGRYARHRC